MLGPWYGYDRDVRRATTLSLHKKKLSKKSNCVVWFVLVRDMWNDWYVLLAVQWENLSRNTHQCL